MIDMALETALLWENRKVQQKKKKPSREKQLRRTRRKPQRTTFVTLM
jgi:hypothetical protein